MEKTSFALTQADIPTHWYNLAADFSEPMLPPLHPGTKQPVTLQDMTAIFPENLVMQEMCPDRLVEIPDEVRSIYALWRPTPLLRAVRLEKALQTPAHIYYKYEGASPAGSHKPNTAVPQAYYNKVFGIKRLTTETGAGQWGSALSFACCLFGLHCRVYMVRISFDQKPFRKLMMQTWGGECLPSPSENTEIGRKILDDDPDTPGSLGIAISEAIEDCVKSQDTRYSLGSVLNHVLLHQTIIGLEAQKQMQKIKEYPDVVIGCCGGGSNFAGITFPYVCDKIHGKNVRIVGVEPTACPTLTKAPFVYDHGDMGGMTPLLPMYSLGHTFVPKPIHAGGLRYHGMAPLVSHVLREGLMEAVAIHQLECYDAALLWARTEGHIPAPETSHAIAQAIREAKLAKQEGKERVILFNWSGHGLMDLSGYDAFLQGHLHDYHLSDEEMAKSIASTANYPKPPAL